MADPTTRSVAAALRAAGHQSYAVARRCAPAVGYELTELGRAVRVTWCSSWGDTYDTASRDAALTAWAAALARWDVVREGPCSLMVREPMPTSLKEHT